jgi:nucleotide-binding universal stress UspA family protein
MKKILCPVDFSNASKNGLEFAGNLAAHLMAHLTLLYVRPTIWPEAVQLKHDEAVSTDEITEDLRILSDEVEKEFGITCGIQLVPTTQVVEKAIAEHGEDFDLIITGTNGADDFYQLVFGSHSFHVIKDAMCPVLLIPEDCKYKPLKNIVYAFDPHTNPIFLVDQLRTFASSLGASIKVVHVVESERSAEEDHKIQQMKQTVMAREHKDIPWNFEGVYGRDIAWTLEHYATSHDVDVLALSYHHRSLMDNLTRQNVIKRISMTAEFPVFTFWR